MEKKIEKVNLDMLYADTRELELAILDGNDYKIDTAFQKLLIDIIAYFGYDTYYYEL